MFTRETLIIVARTAAKRHAVDEALFCALCEHESQGFQWAATRYEPGFYGKYVVGQHLLSMTEATERAMSFGITQIMGQVAREFGFKGEFLSELLDPEIGGEFGCLKLKSCLSRHPSDTVTALLEYNGGKNPAYPSLVLAHLASFT